MNIKIRKAIEEDFPAIFSLIQELALFEKAPEKLTNSLDQMIEEKNYIQCFVAETETKEIIGTLTNPNIEKIYSLGPNLVLAVDRTNRSQTIEKLRSLGLNVIVFQECNN